MQLLAYHPNSNLGTHIYEDCLQRSFLTNHTGPVETKPSGQMFAPGFLVCCSYQFDSQHSTSPEGCSWTTESAGLMGRSCWSGDSWDVQNTSLQQQNKEHSLSWHSLLSGLKLLSSRTGLSKLLDLCLVQHTRLQYELSSRSL